MTPTCADWQIAFWKGADGELEPEESKALVDHLRGCETCRAAVRQASRTHRILLEASVRAASAPLRISTRRRVAQRGWRVLVLAAAAAAALLVGIGILFVGSRAPEESPKVEPAGAKAPKPSPPPPPTEELAPAGPPSPVEGSAPAGKRNPSAAEAISKPVKPVEALPPAPPEGPAPVPKPVPPTAEAVPQPAKAVEPPRKTEVTVARLEKVEGEAYVVSGGQKARAQAGGGLVEGHGLTVGPKATAWLLYADKTRVKLAADTEVLERGGTAKRLQIVRGVVNAEVSKQLPGQPMVFVTAHGEATVLGTTLRLVVDPDKTRLEVTEGKVKLTRPDGKLVEVSSGHYAVAATGLDLTAKALPREGRVHFAEDFEDARRVNVRWILQEDSFPVSFPGKAIFDVTRGKDPRGTGVNWTVATGGLQTREPLRVPFRVSLDVDASGFGNMFPWVRLLPAPLKKNSKRMLSIERRPPQFELRAVDDQGKTDSITFGRKPEGAVRRERWMVEVHAADLVVWVDGEERDRVKHGLTLAPAYFVTLGASAQHDVPKDAKVEFDEVVVELLKE